MTCFRTPARMTVAAPRGRMPASAPIFARQVNNNRNNASLPRAGD